MGLKLNAEKLKSELSFRQLGRASARRYAFLAASDADAASDALGEHKVVLIPFRTLVSYHFSYPFGRKSKVREALKLNFRPIIGEQEEHLALTPQITKQTQNSTEGTAWFAARAEVEEWEARLGSDKIFWPAQLPFAGEVSGTGLVIWRCARGCAAMWFDGGEPQFSRWLSAADGGADELADWVGKYAESLGKSITNVKIIDEAEASPEYLKRCCETALASAPGLESLDLSNRGANAAVQTEAFFSAAFALVRVLIALGAVLVLCALLLFARASSGRNDFDAAPSRIYKSVFGENSASPISAAARKLRLVTGSGDGAHLTLAATLANLAAAWKADQSAGVTLDAIRYGVESTELQGLADNMNSVQALRDALTKNGFVVRIGDVQQVPSSGLRFNMTLKGARP